MKHWHLAAALVCLCSISARALPAVEWIGKTGFHYQVTSEACFNPNAGIGATTSCSSAPLVLIPQWGFAPLTVGGAFGKDNPMLTIGAGENLTPVLKAALLGALNQTTPAGSLPNLKGLLAPPAAGSPDIVLNIGAKWGAQITGSNKVKGLFLLSIGPAFLF